MTVVEGQKFCQFFNMKFLYVQTTFNFKSDISFCFDALNSNIPLVKYWLQGIFCFKQQKRLSTYTIYTKIPSVHDSNSQFGINI